ncbi:MAG: hypothetical protein ABIA63_10200 [bacterium]
MNPFFLNCLIVSCALCQVDRSEYGKFIFLEKISVQGLEENTFLSELYSQYSDLKWFVINPPKDKSEMVILRIEENARDSFLVKITISIKMPGEEPELKKKLALPRAPDFERNLAGILGLKVKELTLNPIFIRLLLSTIPSNVKAQTLSGRELITPAEFYLSKGRHDFFFVTEKLS